MTDGPGSLPLRPRLTRWVALSLMALTDGGAVVLILGLAAKGLLVSGYAGWIVMLAVGASVFLLMHSSVVARPTDMGLYVRNLVRRRYIPWAAIISVRFGPNRPWAQLDLADGSTWPIMAIQSADGRYAQQQAEVLATWVHRAEGTQPGR